MGRTQLRATELYGELPEDILEGLAKSQSAVTSGVQLWRGMDTNYYESEVRAIRQNRRARDSTRLGVHIFDTYMSLKGLPFRKSNTLSVSLSQDQAAEYGSKVFQIYPFDGALYLQSDQVYDMVEIATKIRNDFFRLKGNDLAQYMNPNDTDARDLADPVQLDGYRLINSLNRLYHRDPSNDFGIAKHIEERLPVYDALFKLQSHSDLSSIKPNHLHSVGEVLVLGTNYVALNLRDQMTMEYHSKN